MEGQEPKPALLSSLPLWVQAMSLVGFPAMVAAFYMLKDIGYIPSVAEANAKVINEIALQHRGQTEVLAEIARIDRAICHNIAKTAKEHEACVE